LRLKKGGEIGDQFDESTRNGGSIDRPTQAANRQSKTNACVCVCLGINKKIKKNLPHQRALSASNGLATRDDGQQRLPLALSLAPLAGGFFFLSFPSLETHTQLKGNPTGVSRPIHATNQPPTCIQGVNRSGTRCLEWCGLWGWLWSERRLCCVGNNNIAFARQQPLGLFENKAEAAARRGAVWTRGDTHTRARDTRGQKAQAAALPAGPSFCFG
jgi:hypothetical protein